MRRTELINMLVRVRSVNDFDLVVSGHETLVNFDLLLRSGAAFVPTRQYMDKPCVYLTLFDMVVSW